uniref:Uncharacterized protein n=1 Tax=Kryptolebias marmoratus TaxID=37003 RepID=A0A3Q2ZT81_KRYMA
FSLCMETERAIVKRFDVVDLHAVSFVQITQQFGSIFKMVHNRIPFIVEDDAVPRSFVPDATGHEFMVFALETAGDHHTGPGQSTEAI